MAAAKNLTFIAFSDEKYSKKVPNGSYIAMLNPESLKWGRSVDYNEEQALDSSSPSSKYSKTPSERVSFELVIDCTGVVDSKRVDMQAEINKLAGVIYTYNGNIHRPNFVMLTWGKTLVFKGVLTSFDTSYTLFRSDGSALRAKVSLEFRSYIDLSTLAKKDDKKSPDMTHRILVRDGDSLPQFSEQVYRSPNYYIQLAQFNGLNKFRQLPAGGELIIPPLVAAVPNNGQ